MDNRKFYSILLRKVAVSMCSTGQCHGSHNDWTHYVVIANIVDISPCKIDLAAFG